MRRFLFVLLLAMALNGYCQVKPSIIGFSANVVNFTGSASGSGNYDPGFSLMYWKGIGKLVDFSVRYNGLFSEYNKSANGASSEYVNEFEGSLHLRPVSDDHFFSPFLTAGIGVGNYGSAWAPYTPLGGGIQLNMGSTDYILLQANCRVSLRNAALDNNVFYSIGFMESLGAPKEKHPVALAAPPVPVVTDRDHDGVPDSVDACPDAPGPASLNGCPDTDGDGIPDKDDKCPTVKGVAKYQGCPIPDTDGDGINDEEDKCPTVKGVARYQGCPIPDRDGDGVNDEEDKCPDIPGDPANQGCPVVKEEVRKKVEYAAKHIYFKTASFILLKKSFTGLDAVVKLLREDTAVKIYIDGYTDNTGKPEKNQVLSEQRAASVKKYFVSKGVEALRIISAGHGSSDPVADNKTAIGRAQNRRVVLKMDYQ